MARRTIDFRRLKEMVSYAQVLGLLGWRPRHHEGRWFRGKCPLREHLSRGDRDFNVSADGWRCFSCREGGDQLRLWQILQGGDALTAALDLCARLKIDPPYLPRRPRQPRPAPGQRRGGGTGGAGVSPASSSVPPCGPAGQDARTPPGPARGSA